MTFEEHLKQVHQLYDFENHCFMCRKKLDKSNRSDEHVFPQWLLEKYNLKKIKMMIPYNNELMYKRYLVPCCKKCNNEKMSYWENSIKNALQGGNKKFLELDENIIAWWITKIYYGNIIKELSVRKEQSNPASEMITNKSMFEKHYNNIYYVLQALFEETKLDGDKLYEIYVFRTDENIEFDYLDDTYRDLVLIKLNDVAIICSYISGKEIRDTYQKYLDVLRNQEIVEYYQILELYARIHFAKGHFKTLYMLCVDDDDNVEVNMKSFKTQEHNDFDLHMTICAVLSTRNYPIDFSALKIGGTITIDLTQ